MIYLVKKKNKFILKKEGMQVGIGIYEKPTILKVFIRFEDAVRYADKNNIHFEYRGEGK